MHIRSAHAPNARVSRLVDGFCEVSTAPHSFYNTVLHSNLFTTHIFMMIILLLITAIIIIFTVIIFILVFYPVSYFSRFSSTLDIFFCFKDKSALISDLFKLAESTSTIQDNCEAIRESHSLITIFKNHGCFINVTLSIVAQLKNLPHSKSDASRCGKKLLKFK